MKRSRKAAFFRTIYRSASNERLQGADAGDEGRTTHEKKTEMVQGRIGHFTDCDQEIVVHSCLTTGRE